ncbi:alpha/beta-hydrolase [Aspergillus heteromorphus CBS 117.55]|uniref:Alpha/beta-hydrolase n=1 Tax=Aspergillus heteromorphus CBS 117.55 TaxID=1448321 RepID=A0A317UX38_9EURO|nr:alpha/beta-hydrolase [Aspergillus heteromorphus CBS 117.55]PWY66096.1 alpha/beta-hydrolase [Aspergillus heteromorphus CBS 117.55]
MHRFFKSEFFNFEFIRILSAAPYGGAEIAECLVAASEIRNDDAESWHRAWLLQADKAKALGDEAVQSGDTVSARRAYLRASNYYRASGYMFHDRPGAPDARVLPLAQQVVDTYALALPLLDTGEAIPLTIPFETLTQTHGLPAYLYLPRNRTTPVPVLLSLGGADSIQEELYYVYAASGPQLGYAVLTFEGPGQGIPLRRDQTRMRPDWEVVVGRVLDFLTAYAQHHPAARLDLSRVAVVGASMGGYYALRAAADPRLGACVAIDPFYDMWDFVRSHVSPALLDAWNAGWVPARVVNGVMAMAMAASFQARWEVGLAMWFFGVDSPTDTLRHMMKYTLARDDGTSRLDRVQCPVLVSGATQSLYLEPESDVLRVFDALAHLGDERREIWIARKPEDGGLQAKIGAIGLVVQRTFRFLDQHLNVTR